MTVKKLFLPLAFSLTLGALFPCCYYDKEDTLYPFKKCDTTNVTYTQTIVPVLSDKCYVCHNAEVGQGGVILDTWESLNVYVANDKLIPAIEHTGPFQMPKSGSRLDDCVLQKFRKWVDNGAPKN